MDEAGGDAVGCSPQVLSPGRSLTSPPGYRTLVARLTGTAEGHCRRSRSPHLGAPVNEPVANPAGRAAPAAADLEIKDAQLIFPAVWADLQERHGPDRLRFP